MRNRFVPALALPFFWTLGMGGLRATQAPGSDENPTANTGALKAQIETGGSYDAHSGNATRAVTDLSVPGALGVYGLDFTRYWNSLRDDRYQNLYLSPAPIPEQPTYFGSPGWSHSWSWGASYDPYVQEVGGDGGDEIYTDSITITFPDGHASKYSITRSKNWHWGQPWGANPYVGPPYLAAHGETNWPPSGTVHDFLCGMAEDGSSFWLYRADGGAVYFHDSNSGYQATKVFDPHGLRTDLHYDPSGRLDRVEQEGGRALIISWTGGRISRVESAGSVGKQAVAYSYPEGTLASVTYLNEPVPGSSTLKVMAKYTYQSYVAPTGFFYAGPLLATADDPRFSGPMRQIQYSYRGAGCRPQDRPDTETGYLGEHFDYFYASPTSIAAEKSWRKDSNGIPFAVSRFTLGCFDGTRTESNGLGGFRKFFYGHSAMWSGSGSRGYELAKLTDFTTIYPLPDGLPAGRQTYSNGHPYHIWDGRGIVTESTYGDGSGLPSEIKHLGSDGTTYKYDRINPGNSEAPDLIRVPNPFHHWLFSTKDERDQTTTYTRLPPPRKTDRLPGRQL
jgi:hypothetical protein